jgi:NitT/TauT family transport system substrate-binding protein
MLLAAALAFTSACGGSSDHGAGEPGKPRVLRIGHFPNVTHAHGLIQHELTREGRGWIEERVGAGVVVEWYTYNAGPSAMEALLSGDLDFTYVGPSPALNAHVKSKGTEVRVLAGATWGGAALVVHADGPLKTPADFRGRKIATPQLGNTQDVACRAWLADNGFHVTQTDGEVHVVPTQNADQLDLFRRGDLDAVWTVEPWVSRLEVEGGGRVFLEESDALTTVLVSSAKLLRDDRELVRKVVRAHADLTTWMAAHPAEAKELVRKELEEETKRAVSPELLDRCWKRMRHDDAVSLGVFEVFVHKAQQAGFLRDAGDLSALVDVAQ